MYIFCVFHFISICGNTHGRVFVFCLHLEGFLVECEVMDEYILLLWQRATIIYLGTELIYSIFLKQANLYLQCSVYFDSGAVLATDEDEATRVSKIKWTNLIYLFFMIE